MTVLLGDFFSLIDELNSPSLLFSSCFDLFFDLLFGGLALEGWF